MKILRWRRSAVNYTDFLNTRLASFGEKIIKENSINQTNNTRSAAVVTTVFIVWLQEFSVLRFSQLIRASYELIKINNNQKKFCSCIKMFHIKVF